MININNNQLGGVDVDNLEQDFLLEHRKDTSLNMILPHFHDGYEIHLTLNDNTIYYVDERKYIGEAGTVAVFNSQEIHRVVVEPGKMYERYYIHFKPQFLEFINQSYSECLWLFSKRNEKFKYFENVIKLTTIDQKQFVNLLNELNYYQANTCISNELKIKIKLVEIILFLNDRYAAGNRFRQSKRYHNEILVSEMIHFIKENLDGDLSMDFLSNKFFISKSTLLRTFKNHFGMTPSEYIGYVRIIESIKFLRAGLPIRTVSFKVGYQDESSFIKKFKKIKGISPKQYILKELNQTHDSK